MKQLISHLFSVTYCSTQAVILPRSVRGGLHMLCALVALTCGALNAGGHAHAGMTTQGMTTQGMTTQGPELEATWLQDPQLIGQLGDGTSIEILSFRGDQVDAVLSYEFPGYSDVQVLDASQLIGLRWRGQLCVMAACQWVQYRIVAGARDASINTMPEHGDNSDVWLFEVEFTRDAEHGEWVKVCDAGRNGGTAMGLFVDGRWAPDGSWKPGGYTFSCQRGVVSKCARSFGYKPWKSLIDRNGRAVDLQPLHHACTRAARADYCGNGVSHTRDGVVIDMFDTHGFNVQVPAPGFVEEARFTGDGALSVQHARLSDWQPRQDGLASCRNALPGQRGAALLTIWSRTDTRR